MNDQTKQPAVYDWQTAIGFALVATASAVGLIVLFTYLVDWVGDFWSQVIYVMVVFGGIFGMAVRSRRKDEADPTRLGRTANLHDRGRWPRPRTWWSCRRHKRRERS